MVPSFEIWPKREGSLSFAGGSHILDLYVIPQLECKLGEAEEKRGSDVHGSQSAQCASGVTIESVGLSVWWITRMSLRGRMRFLCGGEHVTSLLADGSESRPACTHARSWPTIQAVERALSSRDTAVRRCARCSV